MSITQKGARRLELAGKRLLSVAIAQEADVVTARQRARQVAALVGFDHQNEVRIATAVSEIARNAFQYAGGGRIEFAVQLGELRSLEILVSDSGPGIRDLDAILGELYRSRTGMGLGIVGARRLMDRFSVDSEPGAGTRVLLSKYLPQNSAVRTAADISKLASQLMTVKSGGTFDELQHQNQELMRALEDLRQREQELRRLNEELEDTNRGVVALYAELDDKAASLHRADQIKSRFLSHMSHEFRTPLNSILALARLLLSRVDGELTAEQDKQIGYIRRAAEELTEMVNDLLDLAKVEAGKTTVHDSEFYVSNLFGALRGMLRPLQQNEAVALVFEDAEPTLMLRTDEGKVAQILRNLISNALKFTERGEVRVRLELSDEGVTFSVCDTGIGIPDDQHDLIFHEFAQLEHPIQRRVKGTGLGLPLSRKLAELLGGSLTLESAVGSGSRFYFRLPPQSVVRSASEAEEPAGDGGPAVRGSRAGTDTLLVIDDDEVSRYLVKQVLRGTDVAVTEAENGMIGLERARFDRPRLILLDLNMPGMNGFEVLDELKSQPETQDIPVVIYTSRSLSQGERERLAKSAACVLPKRDLDNTEFIATIRRFVGAAQRP